MKQEHSKYVKNLFIKKMKEEFPEYIFWKSSKSQGLDYNFVKKDENSWKMISVQHNKNEESFTIEIMWSKYKKAKLIENTLFSNININTPLKIEDDVWLSLDNIRIRLSNFWTESFDSWWVIDKKGDFLKSINDYSYITEDTYIHFCNYNFSSDSDILNEKERKYFIDPLVDNSIDMIKKYAISLFERMDLNLSSQKK